jgi:hypothetical protein
LRRQWPGLSILPKLWDLFFLFTFLLSCEALLRSEEKRKNESVGERSALGEAETEVFVDSAEARISKLFSKKWVICK